MTIASAALASPMMGWQSARAHGTASLKSGTEKPLKKPGGRPRSRNRIEKIFGQLQKLILVFKAFHPFSKK